MKISVIMPAYNAGAFIADAIESLITQSQGNWQLVIVDDGSSDDTFEVASRYERLDNRIQVLRQENQGPSAARGRGVASASGEWITFLDADDCLEPNAVETFTNCVEKGNNLDGNTIHKPSVWKSTAGRRFYKNITQDHGANYSIAVYLRRTSLIYRLILGAARTGL